METRLEASPRHGGQGFFELLLLIRRGGDPSGRQSSYMGSVKVCHRSGSFNLFWRDKKAGWVQSDTGQVHSYRPGFHCVCPGYLPDNRDGCRSWISTAADIRFAMPDDNIHVWPFFDG